MANRYTRQFLATFAPSVVKVFAKVTFAGTGTPSLTASGSKGVLSLTRNGVGDYTFVFGTTGNGVGQKDVYNALLNTRVVFDNGNSVPAAPGLSIKTNAVATFGTSALTFLLFSSAGSKADPGTGEIGYFEITLLNSSAP